MGGKVRRWGFYGLMAAFFLAGRVTGQRLFFLLFFAQAILLLCAYAMDWFTAYAFAYTQEVDKAEAEKGESVTLTVGIYNDLPYPFPMMKVRLGAVSSKDDGVFVFDLPARSHITLTHTLPCPYRGEYAVGLREVEIHDVFGLTRIRFPLMRRPYHRLCPLLVCPKRVDLPDLPGRGPDKKQFAGGTLLLSPQGEDLAGVRDYRPGDTAKRIHWKASARRQELLTRQYETPGEEGAALLLDLWREEAPARGLPWGKAGRRRAEEAAAAEEEARRTADLICTCAGALAGFYLEEGREVSLAAGSGMPFSASSAGAYPELARFLARLPCSPQSGAEGASGDLLIRSGAPLYLITARMNGELSALLEGAVGRGRSVVCVFTGPDRPAALPGGVVLLHIPGEEGLAEGLARLWE